MLIVKKTAIKKLYYETNSCIADVTVRLRRRRQYQGISYEHCNKCTTGYQLEAWQKISVG